MKKKIIAITALFLISALLLAACSGSPKLQEGERYFEGDIAFDYADSCTVYYVLKPDGLSIRDATVILRNYSFSERYESGSISRTVKENATVKSMNFGGGEPDGQGFLELKMSEAALRLNITSDGASGEFDYSYKSKRNEKPSIEIPLGTYPFTMEDRTDSLESE